MLDRKYWGDKPKTALPPGTIDTQMHMGHRKVFFQARQLILKGA